jgi:hypothetical protein
MEIAMPNDALTCQLLEWIGGEPRNYMETIDAWRTSCPHLTVWEDAISGGFIERVPGPTMRDAMVRVTEVGIAYTKRLRLGDEAGPSTFASRALDAAPRNVGAGEDIER